MTWTTLACLECGYRPGGERTQYRHVETTGHTTFVYKPTTGTTNETATAEGPRP